MNHFCIRDEDEIDLTWECAVRTRCCSPSAVALQSWKQLLFDEGSPFFLGQLEEKPGLFFLL